MVDSELQQQYAGAQSRTDAKLRYTIVHLEELCNAERRSDDFERAHQESFLFHLFGVRDAYLQELNLFHGCGIDIEKVTKGRLEQELKNKGIQSAALERLSQVEDDQEGWLGRAKEMRNHAMHRQNILRVYHLGGEYHGAVHLKDTRSGDEIKKDCPRLFEQWVEEMRSLIQELRASCEGGGTA